MTKLKKTPIGEIPEDWEVVKIKDIVKDILTGATPLRSRKEFWENGTIPWLTNEEVIDGKINYIYNTNQKITQLALKKTNVKLVPPNSVILSLTASVGKVAINKIPITTNQQFNSFVVDETRVLPEFLAYYFIFAKKRIELLGGVTTFKFISKSKISNFTVPLPPLPEQRKIAEILRTVDEAIEKTDLAIERTERLKKGLMQRLLTRGIKHERFKKTELGEIPEEWRVVRLGETVEVYDNQRIPLSERERANRKGPYPYCGANGIIDYIDDYIFEGEYVLLAEDGGYYGPFESSTYIMKGKFWVNNHAHILKAKKDIANNQFILYVLNFLDLTPYVVGSTRKKLNQSHMKRIKLPLPPLEEQKKIAEILSTVDKKLELLRRRREKLERVKRGLMKDLLTGRRRAKV